MPNSLITEGPGFMSRKGLALVRAYMARPRTWREVSADLGHTAEGKPIKIGERFLIRTEEIKPSNRCFPDTFRTEDGVTFRVSRQWTSTEFEKLIRREKELRRAGKL